MGNDDAIVSVLGASLRDGVRFLWDFVEGVPLLAAPRLFRPGLLVVVELDLLAELVELLEIFGGFFDEAEGLPPNFLFDLLELLGDLLVVGVVHQVDELVVGDVAPILFSECFGVVTLGSRKRIHPCGPLRKRC